MKFNAKVTLLKGRVTHRRYFGLRLTDLDTEEEFYLKMSISSYQQQKVRLHDGFYPDDKDHFPEDSDKMRALFQSIAERIS